ncbi:MAG: hypothetical protein JWP38_3120, partial [Herbaspirillum sp.]|nr:hypothetical protein [Herbaspirillum sp.]
VNHRLIAAKQTEPIRSLQLFDIVGIAKLSGDRQWINQLLPIGQEQLDACYTPYWWDSIAPWGKCDFIAGTVMNEKFKTIGSERDIKPDSAKLMGLWINSIRHHPFFYAEHRIKHFNAELNFFVPSLLCRFGKDDETHCQIFDQDPDQRAQHLRSEIKRDHVRKNIAFWPVTWFVAGLGLLVALRRRNDNPASTAVAARVLAASGSLYGGAYLLIGVASETRYMYWTMLAAILACLIGYRDVKQVWAARDRPTLVVAGLIVIVLLLGFVARIADIQTMVR